MKRKISEISQYLNCFSIPDDVWNVIFGYLDRFDLKYLAMSCQFFLEKIVPFGFLHKKVRYFHDDMEFNIENGDLVRNLTISRDELKKTDIRDIFKIFSNLKTLTCPYTDTPIPGTVTKFKTYRYEYFPKNIPSHIKSLVLCSVPKRFKKEHCYSKLNKLIIDLRIPIKNPDDRNKIDFYFKDIRQLILTDHDIPNIFFENIEHLTMNWGKKLNLTGVKKLTLIIQKCENIDIDISKYPHIEYLEIKNSMGKKFVLDIKLPPNLKTFVCEYNIAKNVVLPEKLKFLTVKEVYGHQLPPNLKYLNFVEILPKIGRLPKTLEHIVMNEDIITDQLYELPNLKILDYSKLEIGDSHGNVDDNALEIYRGYLDILILPPDFEGSLYKDYYKSIYYGKLKIK